MIAKMRKITLVGLMSEREELIRRLQDAGAAHVIVSPDAMEQPDAVRDLQKVVETRKFLARRTEKKAHGVSEEDWSEICARRTELGQRETRLQGEVAALGKERRQMLPWGEFDWDDIDALRAADLYVGFYQVPPKVYETLDLGGVVHQVVSDDFGDVAFATFSRMPPELDLIEEKLPQKSLSFIEREIELRLAKLDKIDREYIDLSVHLERLQEAEAKLTDHLEFKRVMDGAENHLQDSVFTLQCWSPIPDKELIEKLGPEVTVYHYSEDPSEDDKVPVMMDNKAPFQPGEDLVKIYSYPNYEDFDPSSLVLYWFALFFGMIIGDAGYGLVLLALTVFLNVKIKEPGPLARRLVKMMYLLSGAVIFFGVISASYFNVSLGEGNLLTKVRIFNFGTPEGQSFVMLVSIFIGMAHISLSLAIQGYRRKDPAQFGWVVVIWAGYVLVNSKMGHGQSNPAAMWIMIAGLAVVFVFSSDSKNIALRLAGGINGLLGIVQIFSDVLSYLRLFALSVATVYMSQTFNMLAGDLSESIPYVGWLFAVIVLVLGHFINIVLAIMGGVIHGLRLNFLEWYRWCFEGDGLPYRPFTKISK